MMNYVSDNKNISNYRQKGNNNCELFVKF
jgi:hypothetical protein